MIAAGAMADRVSFDGLDLRGERLVDAKLAGASFRGANLDGVDLSGAVLEHVDLTGASLCGAILDGCTFRFVAARGCVCGSATARRAFFEHCDFSHADFSASRLEHATARACTFESATFDDANLSDANLVKCTCDSATFRQTRMTCAATVGSTFVAADLATAKQFFLCREIVVEILKRELPTLDQDASLAQLVGAVALHRGWCYPQWKRILESHPEYARLALDIFEKYPSSGFVHALQIGWDYRTSSVDECAP